MIKKKRIITGSLTNSKSSISNDALELLEFTRLLLLSSNSFPSYQTINIYNFKL